MTQQVTNGHSDTEDQVPALTRAKNWLLGVGAELISPTVAIGAFIFFATWAYTHIVESLTVPYARQSVYFDSKAVLNELRGSGSVQPVPLPTELDDLEACVPVTHVRYEVENRGPGDLADVKLVIPIRAVDVPLISAKHLFTGYPHFTKFGSQNAIVVTTLPEEKGLSPLKNGERFGVKLTIPKAEWKPQSVAVLRQASSEELEVSDQPAPTSSKTPYWIATASGFCVLGFAVSGAFFRYRYKVKQAERNQLWRDTEGTKIKREAAETLHKSDATNRSAEELLAILNERTLD